MIFEFTIALVVGLSFIYMALKLWNKYQLKKLRLKYPEGSETKSVKVTRFDEIPTSTESKDDVVSQELVDKLKE